MSKHVRSRSLWEVLLQDEESPEPVGPVVVSAFMFHVSLPRHTFPESSLERLSMQ